MKSFVVMTLVTITTAACSSGTTDKPAAAEAASAAKAAHAEMGDFGLDLTARKPGVKPGDDFFSYANGSWFDTFKIPDDRASFGVFHKLDEVAQERLRKIIEEAAAGKPAPGSPEQKIGDYYSSYMDEAAIEAKGLEPAAADLKLIADAKSKQDIARLFGLPGFKSTFSVGLPPDLKNPDRYSISIGQAGLGLPDRDYYLKNDPKLVEVRAKYLAYIEQMLTLGGAPNAAAQAKVILDFETKVARAQWSIEQQRDVEANYNPRTKKEILAYAKGFDWQSFFDASELGGREEFVLGELPAIRDLARLVDKEPLETLKAYLTFHYLSDHAVYLPKRFDEARFAFYGQTLRGQPKQRERWKRAVSGVNEALGEQVGQVYVAKYFPPESKQKMEALVTNLKKALAERLDQLAWMTPVTKLKAHEKLNTFVTKIGYPDKWKDYSDLEVIRGDAIGNARRASLWEWHYQLERLDKPVDRDEWQMNPQTINAYYNPLNNEIVFPAAILQPPFFDPNADAAVNYGGIGAVIGHEMGHGFDDQGRKFAADGSLKDWWTDEDSVAFTGRVTKLIEQFSGFEALPGLKVNGAITVGENIGDLGGLNMAYHAYHLSLNGKEPPVLDGLTGDQRFFLSWAQVWRAKYRDEALREQVMSDVHSPAYFRVNGPVANIDAWYQAFDVKPGDKLYVKPEDRVSIW